MSPTLSLVLALVLFSPPLWAQTSGRDSILPAYLSWYARWKTEGTLALSQRCDAVRVGDLTTVVCVPPGIRIDLEVRRDGECRPLAIQATKRPVSAAAHDLSQATDLTRHQGGKDCLGLEAGGARSLSVEAASSSVDSKLSASARDIAARWLISAGDLSTKGNDCLIYFPMVRRGEPFYHVHAACNGEVGTIWEFQFESDGVMPFPHWTYYADAGGVPPGAQKRVRSRLYWLEVVRPKVLLDRLRLGR